MTIEEIGYLEELRQALGIESDSTSKDEEIVKMAPMDRMRLLFQWEFGDPSWADTIVGWFESQGFSISHEDE